MVSMPLYEYYCHDCNARFDLLTSYQNADTNIICQECHSPRVRRLLSVVAKTRKGESAGYEFTGESDFAGDSDFGGSCGCGGNCSCH